MTGALVALVLALQAPPAGAPPARAAVPGPREGHALVYDEEQKQVLLLSGFQPPDQPPLDELWAWDGRRWHLIPGAGPSARSLVGAAYDARRKCVVFFGGVGNTGYDDLRDDTWEWNGTSWLKAADRGAGTRDHHVMVFDAKRGVTLMYGGTGATRAADTDTWRWDGIRWTGVSAPGPGARVHFAMAYDERRERVVLFGGHWEGRTFGDTWTWDGTAWKEVASSGPSPRSAHRMVFDAHAGVVLLYGGRGANGYLDDTWAWDGKGWTQLEEIGPGKRGLAAMAYDRARDRTVLYGGDAGDGPLGDTWEWDGAGWSQVR